MYVTGNESQHWSNSDTINISLDLKIGLDRVPNTICAYTLLNNLKCRIARPPTTLALSMLQALTGPLLVETTPRYRTVVPTKENHLTAWMVQTEH